MHLELQFKKRQQEESIVCEDEQQHVSIDKTSTNQIYHSIDQNFQNQINFNIILMVITVIIFQI